MAQSLVQRVTLLLSLSNVFFGASDARVGHKHRRNAEHHGALEQRAAGPATVSGWSYAGCFTDGGTRTLPGSWYGSASAMTLQSCISYCSGLGYVYAGTEYSTECYCGNTTPATTLKAPDSDCNMACSGNASQPCGAGYRLTTYWSGAAPPAAPVVNPGVNGFVSQGCYTDDQGARTLTNGVATTGGGSVMTVALCVSACKTAGYTFAGAEYGGECYCGNAISNTGVVATSGCSMLCNGNSSEYCGGGNRLNVYKLGGTAVASSTAAASSAAATAGWVAAGCYSDNVGGRTLTVQTMFGQASTVTHETCNAACRALGYTFAGTEYSSECYCGNAISNGGAVVTDGCTMACAGNAAQICGGPNRLTVYKYVDGTTPSGTSSAAVSSTPATSSVSTGPTTLPTGWSYKGCWIDGVNGRILANQQPDSNTNTIETCVATCRGLGYGIAGLQYGVQCFCDNFLRNGAATAPEADCNMACAGNAAEKCGAGNRFSIYSNATLQVYQPPAVQKTGLPGNWTYKGCLWDYDTPRSLKYQIIFDTNNTATNCLSKCSEFGYGAGGMEYGRECWCGDEQNVIDSGNAMRAEADCSMPCSGNSSSLCGGGNAISYYTWTGTPLNSWSFPTGVNAGTYEFLIGGVVIPLITANAINGKITYIEKHGTGAANATGAYELDLTLKDDFAKAWRPMHVQSDVFCAATLTLPDRAGRQMNIGGWANEDTYRIRLYAPDGSPGVWGVNDWQEDSSLRMQVGRWYPTAMQMSNGSILVIGGSSGSNADTVPNLEILPKPAGGFVKYCDWLERTNQFNLYPFMAVLPSGGIFAGYYNEARILDPVTFDTIKVLPNIPGAVNNFLGGRTYPFEGSMMIMPQRYPYSELLTIMLCGGSIPGPEIALDNCVSIQPDAASPKWVIERMPSKRVLSCMTALPDGTYLITNGGQQGRAGFGLTSEPNTNAVLYDPSKKVNTRMSVMANTTVYRMYHSESILMQDGRVLISGSDPQDIDRGYPQEYRNEVFTPPYLLKGGTRPVFTLSQKDLAYGATTTVTITNGATANIQITLMGAESSTHGATMGQRTFFPLISCSGATCTVTAPPDNKICPPGWFQLYVLSNGVPSKSTWVRIGGDPGHVGEWPAGNDLFYKPGMGAALPSY